MNFYTFITYLLNLKQTTIHMKITYSDIENKDFSDIKLSTFLYLFNTLSTMNFEFFGDVVHQFIVPFEHHFRGKNPTLENVQELLIHHKSMVNIDKIQIILPENEGFIFTLKDKLNEVFDDIEELDICNFDISMDDTLIIKVKIEAPNICDYFDVEFILSPSFYFDIESLSWKKNEGFKLLDTSKYTLIDILGRKVFDELLLPTFFRSFKNNWDKMTVLCIDKIKDNICNGKAIQLPAYESKPITDLVIYKSYMNIFEKGFQVVNTRELKFKFIEDDLKREDDNCPICHSSLYKHNPDEYLIETKCGHEYHFSCLMKWFIMSNEEGSMTATCPLDRIKNKFWNLEED